MQKYPRSNTWTNTCHFKISRSSSFKQIFILIKCGCSPENFLSLNENLRKSTKDHSDDMNDSNLDMFRCHKTDTARIRSISIVLKLSTAIFSTTTLSLSILVKLSIHHLVHINKHLIEHIWRFWQIEHLSTRLDSLNQETTYLTVHPSIQIRQRKRWVHNDRTPMLSGWPITILSTACNDNPTVAPY